MLYKNSKEIKFYNSDIDLYINHHCQCLSTKRARIAPLTLFCCKSSNLSN